MKNRLLILLAVAALLFSAAVPIATPAFAQEDEEGLEPELVTATVQADLVRPGRVLMSARGNHWIYDSVPPLNGPNEEVNPLDGVLGALVSCGMFIYEAVSIEEEIALDHLSANVVSELDPRGVAGFDVDPRMRAFHITMNVEGPTADEAAMMAKAFSLRCPIYTTLGRAAPIDVTNVVDGEAQAPITTEAVAHEGDEAETEELELAKPMVSGKLVEFGRASLAARGNHWIYDSVPPINGPNEEVNPLDALLGALPACGIMVVEAAARENDIPLNAINATVEGDLDPRGVAGMDVNPRIRAFRVTMHVSGPTMDEAGFLADEWRARCPAYTTFERAAPIEIEIVNMDAVTSLDFEFGTHPELGMPEQHVLILSDGLDEGMGMRPSVEDAEVAENLEMEIFASMSDIGHDPFMLEAEPLGPFAVGSSLELTLGDWLAASGGGTYTVRGDEATVSLAMENLVPNGLYTLWCTRINLPPAFDMDNQPCGASDGSENTFRVDEDGSAAFELSMDGLLPSEETAVSVLALAYHSDDNTYGDSPGAFGQNSHVQLFTILPPPDQEVWQVHDDGGVVQHTPGTVVTHPSTGAMEPVEGGNADLFTNRHGATARMHTTGLTPGNVYTAWWVIANDPTACEDSPCSPADFLQRTDAVQTEVTYGGGIIVGPNGEGDFAAYLPAGAVTNNPWFGHDFPDPTQAEIHLVLNDHGPLIPEMAENMLNTYRGGCTDESLPGPFPDTAKADGEAGPNTCGLVQAAIFQQ